jgi:hypothetical protein
MEPVTPAGSAYVSQAFAALVREKGIDEFGFDYAGEIQLPKGAGMAKLYAMHRTLAKSRALGTTV